MKKAFFFIFATMLLMGACGTKQEQPTTDVADDAISLKKNLPGDSALYGLACDGCTDSVLVFLPYSGGDPDTFDIINAFQEHRIYGRPRIGDELAVIVNPADRDEALSVVNMEMLKGEWCYQVLPQLRSVDSLHKRMQRRMIARMSDSLRQLMITPREYSLRLKRDYTVTARGGQRRRTTTDDMSPVVYPTLKRYTDWYFYNGMLILKADTIAGISKEGDVPETDTAQIRLLMPDSLILEFSDHTQEYYRKIE